jgi:hypothetical protein
VKRIVPLQHSLGHTHMTGVPGISLHIVEWWGRCIDILWMKQEFDTLPNYLHNFSVTIWAWFALLENVKSFLEFRRYGFFWNPELVLTTWQGETWSLAQFCELTAENQIAQILRFHSIKCVCSAGADAACLH